MMADGLIVGIYFASMFFGLIAFICGGLLIWFRTPVFNALKLNKLVKFGYIICRLKRIDKTEKEIVTIPNKETNGVRSPGVEGMYTLDTSAVIPIVRCVPGYEWREGE